ncbi:hypothetical protein H4J57_19355 [Colwellia sp. BRX8-7]|jgi:hypothetical protein|uniref:hypothetical protein n=1 Tax=Colwellia sp. BRX8-7 TaxID=2759833 RepID=UPI0015F4D7B2|nr:hypothetical protein [Colwellia sp. BRX8-7]MBA6339344.1 hypothetical protein [Colwellia sp. BRX8-7]
MKPDYSKYNIGELQDVISHIDSKAYPDRKLEAEEVLRYKLNSGEVDDKPINNETNKRQLGVFLSTVFILVSLVLLYKPVFENSVITRSSGVINYSQSPFAFWFHTLLYLITLLSCIFWLVKLIRSK